MVFYEGVVFDLLVESWIIGVRFVLMDVGCGQCDGCCADGVGVVVCGGDVVDECLYLWMCCEVFVFWYAVW